MDNSDHGVFVFYFVVIFAWLWAIFVKLTEIADKL